MDTGVEVGLLHVALELAGQQAGDPVAALGAVEGYPSYAIGDLVGEGLRGHRQVSHAPCRP